MRQVTDNTNHLMESMHLRKYSEKQYKLELTAEQQTSEEHARAEAQASAFRASLLRKMGLGRKAKTKMLQHDDAVHAAILKRKVEG